MNTGETKMTTTKMKAEMQGVDYNTRLLNALIEADTDYRHIFQSHVHKSRWNRVAKLLSQRYGVERFDINLILANNCSSFGGEDGKKFVRPNPLRMEIN
jgi:hypothetical protein